MALPGVIEGRDEKRGPLFIVRLQDGRRVSAVLSLPMARARIGCILDSLAGYQVQVRFPAPPKLPRIIDIRPEPK